MVSPIISYFSKIYCKKLFHSLYSAYFIFFSSTLQLEFNHSKQKYYYQLAGVSINHTNHKINNNETINNNNSQNKKLNQIQNIKNNNNNNSDNNNICGMGSSVDIEDHKNTMQQPPLNTHPHPPSSNLFILLPVGLFTFFTF